jgi:hypothetical protein
MNLRPAERLEKTLARVAKEQGLSQEMQVVEFYPCQDSVVFIIAMMWLHNSCSGIPDNGRQMTVEVCQHAYRETCSHAFVVVRGREHSSFPPGWHFGEPQLRKKILYCGQLCAITNKLAANYPSYM